MIDIKDKVYDEISAGQLKAYSVLSWEYCEVKSCVSGVFLLILSIGEVGLVPDCGLSPRLWAYYWSIIMEGINLRDIS